MLLLPRYDTRIFETVVPEFDYTAQHYLMPVGVNNLEYNYLKWLDAQPTPPPPLPRKAIEPPRPFDRKGAYDRALREQDEVLMGLREGNEVLRRAKELKEQKEREEAEKKKAEKAEKKKAEDAEKKKEEAAESEKKKTEKQGKAKQKDGEKKKKANKKKKRGKYANPQWRRAPRPKKKVDSHQASCELDD